MKNKIIKLFVLLAIILPTCINFTSCDYATYNIYPESTNGADNEKTNSGSEKSSEMLALFKTSKNIGRPLKLKIKIYVEKKSSLGPLNCYPLSSRQKRMLVYCHDNFSVIDPPKINFDGEGNPSLWNTSDNSIDFKIKIESDIPPLEDLPIYFADQLLGYLKVFNQEAEFTISGSANFLFKNYISNSSTYIHTEEETIISEGNTSGEEGETGGDSQIKIHRHRITTSGNLINAQSPESINIYLDGKNILEDFPLVIGEVNIPLENVSLKFIFNTSVNISGTATISNTNSCCIPWTADDDVTEVTSSSQDNSSTTAYWDFSYETAKDPILLVPISIVEEEENMEVSDTDTEIDETQSI